MRDICHTQRDIGFYSPRIYPDEKGVFSIFQPSIFSAIAKPWR